MPPLEPPLVLPLPRQCWASLLKPTSSRQQLWLWFCGADTCPCETSLGPPSSFSCGNLPASHILIIFQSWSWARIKSVIHDGSCFGHAPSQGCILPLWKVGSGVVFSFWGRYVLEVNSDSFNPPHLRAFLRKPTVSGVRMCFASQNVNRMPPPRQPQFSGCTSEPLVHIYKVLWYPRWKDSI